MHKPLPPNPSGPGEDSVPRISQSMARMRLMTGRRLIGRLVIRTVAPDLELSHLDVLSVVASAEGADEVTVGTIADMLRIDPSRASRIVTDMVRRNVLRRKACKADARRIVVVMTPAGRRLLSAVRALKLETVNRIVAGWPEKDVETFAVLFEKFLSGYEAIFPAQDGDTPG
jgi:DNA-binding MarR family transcriptional regulator